MSRSDREAVDVLIVGAGLSGVAAAQALKTRCPQKSFAILEARAAAGGTWDLFRYPGVRSDSDMYTLGFSFRPWTRDQAIADGGAIRDYIDETIDALGVREKIRFGTRVVSCEWSSTKARWRVVAERDGDRAEIDCRFLVMGAGYYQYNEGYTPDFSGRDAFAGVVVHPQQWPEDLDVAGKTVAVIGSGATAITLAPALVTEGAKVVMAQRSPTYVFAMPGRSALSRRLSRLLPGALAFRLMRWQRIILQQITYKLARAAPKKTAAKLKKAAASLLPEGYEVERHFSPRYDPWSERLCVTPDGDFFRAIRRGDLKVVTDAVDGFTPNGLKLASGSEIEADIVVTATGLNLQMWGGAEIRVDGRRLQAGDLLTYRGVLFEGAPNFASIFGYVNASWTLRAELAAQYICRLINHMDRRGADAVTPVNPEPDQSRSPYVDFSSGYFQRAADLTPKQGACAPWRHPQDYFADLSGLKFAPIGGPELKFFNAGTADAQPRAQRVEEATA